MVTTIGTIAAAYLATRTGKLGRLGKVEESAKWKERFETEREKVNDWRDRYETKVEELTAETAARREAASRADFAERDADTCARRLSDLYAELRRNGRLVDRRSVPREERPKA